MGNAITRLDDLYNQNEEAPDTAPDTYYRGVSLEFLKDILGRGKEYETATGNGIKALVTYPETDELKCSLAEVYDEDDAPTGKPPYIGKVQFFVSHAWKYTFSELVQGIERFEKDDEKRAGAYYFIDYFAVNQNKPQNDLESLSWIIKNSDALVLVLSPLEKPIPMTRCWCLLELMVAMQNRIPIIGTVPDNQHALMRTRLITGSNLKFEVDAENAQASVAKDRVNILAQIKYSIGFKVLNDMARNKFKSCVMGLVFSEIKKEENETMREQLGVGLAKMLREDSITNKQQNTEEEKERYSFPNSPEKKMAIIKEHSGEDLKEPEYHEVPETILCDHDWQFCSLTWTPPVSLSLVFAEIYKLNIGELEDKGELEDISELVLEYIGGCECSEKQLSHGIFSQFIHSDLCDHCKGNCICVESIFLCNVCWLRGINYCTQCKFRHVGSHQCK